MSAENRAFQGISNFDSAPRKEAEEFPNVALIFPGQGSQFPGMGYPLYRSSSVARDVFERADKAAGKKYSTLCFEGSAEELRRTDIAQPVIYITSVAVFEALSYERAKNGFPPILPSFVAGHSLGEYTALVAAGALSFEEGLRIVIERGRLMHEASMIEEGSMAAIMGMELDITAIEDVCQHTDAQIANENSPEQVIISGSKDSIANASNLLRARGAKRIVPLEVGGAFHSYLMQPAVKGMEKALEQVKIKDPIVPVVGNNATLMYTSSQILHELRRQIVMPVKWQQSIKKMSDMGAKVFLEIGPKRTLTNFVGKIVEGATALSISNPSDIQSLALNPSA